MGPGGGPAEPEWPELSKQSYEQARARFNVLDVDGAKTAIESAIVAEPDRAAIRILAAHIALSQMQYEEALQQLRGLSSSQATGLRARALWYSGQVAAAAEELDRLLADPEVEDGWASGVSALARTGGGREPFRLTGSLLAVSEMPRLPIPSLIVPVELNGEQVLAMIATGSPEVVLDSPKEQPSWVSLRFARRLEVKDVPALGRDLSGLAKRVGAPVRLLLGVNLLRRLNATFDFHAGQFVVRSFAPPPPPRASAIDVSYIKGGGMVMRSRFGVEPTSPAASFLVDTSVLFPLALSDAAWNKTGADPATFHAVAGDAKLSQGVVPGLTLGSFSLPGIPGIRGMNFSDLSQGGGIELDGVIGAALMAEFRVSLVDSGRTLWLEQMPTPAVSAVAP